MAFNLKQHSILKLPLKKNSALNQAEALQDVAAEHGFEWPDIKPVFDKLFEEIDELKVEVNKRANSADKTSHTREITSELGDVLFCCVNLARFLNVNPEQALLGTNEKFRRRFQYIEKHLYNTGKTLKSSSLEELDLLWDQAKETGL